MGLGKNNIYWLKKNNRSYTSISIIEIEITQIIIIMRYKTKVW